MTYELRGPQKNILEVRAYSGLVASIPLAAGACCSLDFGLSSCLASAMATLVGGAMHREVAGWEDDSTFSVGNYVAVK